MIHNKSKTLRVEINSYSINEKKIFRDIFFEINSPGITSILGRGGKGKSVFLQLLYGSCKSPGVNVFYKGLKVKRLVSVKNAAAFLPQFSFLPPGLTVKQCIAAYHKKKSYDLISSHPLIGSCLNQKAAALSGGERRILEILLVLHLDKEILLLDEPFTGLAPQMIEMMIEEIKKQGTCKSIIIASASYRNLADCSTNFWILDNGTLFLSGGTEKLRALGFLPLIREAPEIIPSSAEAGEFMEISQSTLDDLEIFKCSGGMSIFDHLDRTKTIRGKEKLKEIFTRPFANISAIKERQNLILFLLANFDKWSPLRNLLQELDYLSDYLSLNFSCMNPGSKLINYFKALSWKLSDSAYYNPVMGGVKGMMILLGGLHDFFLQLDNTSLPALPLKIVGALKNLFEGPDIPAVLKSFGKKSLSSYECFLFDRIFREWGKDILPALFDHLYELDAVFSMALATYQKGFTFPKFHEKGDTLLARQVYHLFVENPVKNSLTFEGEKNFSFLTGPNMGGKTTFIRALGIGVYLAHLGMGVPAEEMKLPVLKSLISSINMADNIYKGYSYFYQEIHQVKEIALNIKRNRRTLVLLDELFKGTNISDAYNCSKEVIGLFKECPGSFFLLSSHLTELAEEMEGDKKICFNCFEVIEKEDSFDYTYLMKEGISRQKMGFRILQMENIDRILKG